MTDAVVIPGRLFGPATPLLMYAGDVAERRGATIHRHWWSPVPDVVDRPEIADWVRSELTPVLDQVGGTPLLIAKSLGSNAAALATERALPAVWLTPVLTWPWVVEALAAATVPFLLVGGTADSLWDGATARSLTPHVFEVEGANHGLYVPGPLVESIEVLGQMIVAFEEFLDVIGWPG